MMTKKEQRKKIVTLKQAGRGWYLEMSRVFMKELGFARSAIDHSVFYRRDGDAHVIVAVATDDMAVTSKHAVDAEKFKSEIQKFRNSGRLRTTDLSAGSLDFK